MSDPVTWGPMRYERARSAALGVGVTGSLALLGVFALIAAAGLSGEVAWEPVLLFGLLLLVGGPMSFLYLASAYGATTDEKRARIRTALTPRRGDLDWVRPVWLIVGLVAAAGTLAVPEVGGLVLVMGVPVAAGLLFPFSERGGHYVLIDPVDGTVAVYGDDPRQLSDEAEGDGTRPEPERERDLSGLVRVRRLPLDSVALLTLAHRGSTWVSGPFALIVPTDVADDAVAALRSVAAETDPDRLSRAERALVGALGLSFLAVAPLTALLSGDRAALVIGVACVPIGGLCCLLALRA